MKRSAALEALPPRVCVLGAARSGLAAAKYLLDQGVDVFISDTCDKDKLNLALASNDLAQVSHEAGKHTAKVLEYDTIVLSPGIPSDIPVLCQARERGIAVWSEIELAFRRSRSPFVAVTGSTGKSTTVSMIGSIAQAAGRESVVAGNIGTPAITAASELSEHGLAVVEVSSFQLENVDTFKPVVAAVLNLFKNHLDRYDSEESYYEAKKAIARNADSSCSLVLNANDPRLRAWGEDMRSRTNVVYYGRNEQGFGSVWHAGRAIVGRLGERRTKKILDVADLKVAGPHNIDNACAAAAVARLAGIGYEAVADGLSRFTGLPHRLQFAGEHNGVKYYNDSKSTTGESMEAAIRAFGDNVHLIAGGRDKGCDFAVVKDALAHHVKDVALIGEAAARMESQWRSLVPLARCESLQAAVETAGSFAQPGDVVVFSPGCSSFDMFKNYEERGTEFMKIVKEL